MISETGISAVNPPSQAVTPLDDPDFVLAQEALSRAARKAVARALAAGLEPVVTNFEEAVRTAARPEPEEGRRI